MSLMLPCHRCGQGFSSLLHRTGTPMLCPPCEALDDAQKILDEAAREGEFLCPICPPMPLARMRAIAGEHTLMGGVPPDDPNHYQVALECPAGHRYVGTVREENAARRERAVLRGTFGREGDECELGEAGA